MNTNQSSSSPHKPFHSQIIAHERIEGVYRSTDGNTIYTKNLVPGQTLFYSNEVVISDDDGEEYREWNPFNSKLGAAILCGSQNIWIKPGSRVLVIYSRDDNQFGITISHLSDIVGPRGMLYVVDPFNRDALAKLADKRFNIVPIIQGLAPCQYRMLINTVDVLFASLDSEQLFDNAYINAMYFLEAGGHYVVCVKANQGDTPFAVLGIEERRSQFKKIEHVILEPFHSDYAYAIGGFRIVELDEPVTFSTNRFWTAPHLGSQDGDRVTLYEKLKDLPTYLLFDSSLGYALFRACDMYSVERNFIEVEKYISRFDEVFELIAYHPFESFDEAMMYLNAASYETIPKNLIEFVVNYLPEKPMENGVNCYTLSLPQSSMVRPIVSHTRIGCSRSLFHDEILRGVRIHIETFFEDMKQESLEKAQLDLARNFCRQELISPDRVQGSSKKPKVPAAAKKKKQSSPLDRENRR